MATPDMSKTRSANSARNAAVRQLIQKHQDDYTQILTQERIQRGLPAQTGSGASSMRKRAEKMIERMRDMGLDTTAIEQQIANNNW